MPNQIRKGELKNYIREIPDFPKKGILFYDITTLLSNPQALRGAINSLARLFSKEKIDYVVAVESRGFIFGSVLAYKLGAGFVPVRKKGKLPYKTRRVTYDLEYGTDTLEIHDDAIPAKSKILIVDDLLATGGTMKGVSELVTGFNAKIVGVAFLVELKDLKGRDKLSGLPVKSIIRL